MSAGRLRVDADALERFVRDLLEAVGATDEVAAQVAASLVAADLRGHTSHGVLRVPWYATMAEEGRLDPAHVPEIERESGAIATVDGGFAFGQVVGRVATDAAVSLAEEHGVGAVGVRNANHLGRVGEWAERAADAGALFAALVNTGGGGKLVALPGSTDRRIATNPVAFGVPTFDALDFPVVLDVATSQVAHGKIRELAKTGEPIPEGWATDDGGEPMTDALAFERDRAGALLPLGGEVAGYKGFGLAAVAELFAGLVGGSDVMGMDEPEWANNGAAFFAVDPTRVLPRAAIEERVAAFAAHVRETERSSAVSPGVAAEGGADEVLLPGEAEHRALAERRASGVTLPVRVAEALGEIAGDYGATDAVPSAFRG